MQQYYLDATVKVGNNVTIEPYAVIRGNTVLHDNCVIGSFSYLCNAEIGENASIFASRITDSKVGKNVTVGPFAHLRNNAVVENDCRIGNFVEIKDSKLGSNVKASHLAYVGNAEVGKRCNIGCGVIFVNYNGKQKNKTVVGDDCFIGCNSNLIAPVTVGEKCYVACNTTVDGNVPSNAFVIGRSKMVIKENKASKYF